MLVRDRLQAIADAGPEVLAAVAKTVAQTVKKATPLLAELEAGVAALNQARADLRAVADASNAVSTAGTMATPDLPALNVLSLATAVKDGSDPLSGDQVHVGRVLGLRRDVVAPDGSRRTETYQAADDPERKRLREAAYAAQHAQMAGRKAERPLGYRSGMI